MFLPYGNTSYVVGRGAVEHISNIKAKKVALIADYTVLEKFGTLTTVNKLLADKGIDWKLVADISQEPRVSHVEQAKAALAEYKPDFILAIGGGSVLDAAKAMWIFYEYPDIEYSQVFKPFALPPMGKKAKLMAIPTTSGTGSETTCVSVLVDDDTGTKKLIMSREIIPTYAVLDFNLTYSMPRQIAAYSGMDALTHALEAAVCKISSPLVVSTAKIAALEVMKWLPVSVNEEAGTETFKKARDIVHGAASLAGMAINNSSAGLAHAMDQPGPLFNLPHGLVCGILLPYSLYSMGSNPVYAEIAKMLGNTGNEGEPAESLIREITRLRKQVGLPESFKEVGINKESYEARIPEMARLAESSGAAQFAPVEKGRKSVKELFEMAYEGISPI